MTSIQIGDTVSVRYGCFKFFGFVSSKVFDAGIADYLYMFYVGRTPTDGLHSINEDWMLEDYGYEGSVRSTRILLTERIKETHE